MKPYKKFDTGEGYRIAVLKVVGEFHAWTKQKKPKPKVVNK